MSGFVDRLPSFLRIFSLEGKTVIITGATGGLGQSLVGALAASGADIISLQLPTDPPVVKNIVEAQGRKCTIISCDLSNLDSIPPAIEQAFANAPNPSTLINCAGIFSAGPTVSFPTSEIQHILDVNVMAGILCASECVKRWLQQLEPERGIKKILNFASIASFQGNVGTLAYSASKAAVLSMTRSMSSEWAQHGILVNSIAPGFAKSAITAHLYDDEEYNKKIMPGIPCRRWANGDDMTGTVVYLCSAASDYVTGTCAVVDGGVLGYPGLGY